eukprot:3295877-Rhodomonas_salina.1
MQHKRIPSTALRKGNAGPRSTAFRTAHEIKTGTVLLIANTDSEYRVLHSKYGHRRDATSGSPRVIAPGQYCDQYQVRVGAQARDLRFPPPPSPTAALRALLPGSSIATLSTRHAVWYRDIVRQYRA